MIQLVMRYVRPGEEPRLRACMAELGERRAEVLQTFAQEGVRHEQAYLLPTAGGPILVYAIEADDHEAVAAAYRSSALAIDHEHRAIMREVLGGAVDAELLYECRANRRE